MAALRSSKGKISLEIEFFERIRTFRRLRLVDATKSANPWFPIQQFLSLRNSRYLKADESANFAGASSPLIELLKSSRLK